MFVKLVGKGIFFFIGSFIIAIFGLIILMAFAINQIQIWLMD